MEKKGSSMGMKITRQEKPILKSITQVLDCLQCSSTVSNTKRKKFELIIIRLVNKVPLYLCSVKIKINITF